MKNAIHFSGALIATVCIFIFFSSTIIVEAFGSTEAIAIVKQLIVLPGLLILVPSIMATGASGFALGKDRKEQGIQRKMKRMPIIVLNGILVLIPSAIYLNMLAASGTFDKVFYLVQGIELIAGLVNLSLMGMNIRDGLEMSGKLRSNANI